MHVLTVVLAFSLKKLAQSKKPRERAKLADWSRSRRDADKDVMSLMMHASCKRCLKIQPEISPESKTVRLHWPRSVAPCKAFLHIEGPAGSDDL